MSYNKWAKENFINITLYPYSGPAQIEQWPTGKAPGAPNLQSATVYRDLTGFFERCLLYVRIVFPNF